MTGFHLHRGALAAMQRPVLPSLEELLATARGGMPARRVVVLEDLVDHTNVGAAFRSAAALGVDAVLVTPSCADPLYRRAVRVSMGTVFGSVDAPTDLAGPSILTLRRLASPSLRWPSQTIPSHSTTSPRCQPSRDRALASQWSPDTEGDGLARRTITASDYTVKIPMDHEVDSLNVAAASAVVFWATRSIDASSVHTRRDANHLTSYRSRKTRPELVSQPRPRRCWFRQGAHGCRDLVDDVHALFPSGHCARRSRLP